MNIKNEEELISEAHKLITNKDLEQAYNLLSKTGVFTDYKVDSLFLIAQLSMLLKKSDEIPGHIIALKCKRDDGLFTAEQESNFMNLLKEYQKLM